MSISYGELAEIGAMTNEELKEAYRVQCEQKQNEDTNDTINAILSEMEDRNLPHP